MKLLTFILPIFAATVVIASSNPAVLAQAEVTASSAPEPQPTDPAPERIHQCSWPRDYKGYARCLYDDRTGECHWDGCIKVVPLEHKCEECANWMTACIGRKLKDCDKWLCKEGPIWCGACNKWDGSPWCKKGVSM